MDSLGPDYISSCAPAAVGTDAVYHFNAPQSGTVNVLLTPSGFDGILTVRTSCDGTSTPVICVDTGGFNTIELGQLNATALTDYWVFVDSKQAAAAGSSFTMQVNY